MSTREELAGQVAERVRELGLVNPFGGDVSKVERGGRTFYSVLFSKPRVLDGVVEVWGSRFVRVVSRGPAGRGRVVVRDWEEVVGYLDGFVGAGGSGG